MAARKQRQRDKERHRLVVEKLIELYDKAQPDIYLLTRRPTARQLEKITATRDAERMRRREKHNEFRALSLEDAKMLLAVYEENSDRQGAPENDFKDSKGNKLKIGRIERTGEYGLTQLALMSDAAQLEGMNIARPVRPRGYGPDKYEEREPLEDY